MSSLLVMAQMRDVAWWRFEQFHWWHYLLLVLTVIAVLSYVVWWSIRDSHEQLPPVRWALLLLRVVALFGLLLYFGQLDKRTEISVTRNSRVAVLVDTSLSMTLPGTPSASGIASNRTRSEEAIQFVARSPLLEQLSQQHDVTVYRFDQQARPAQVAAIARPTKPSLAADSTSSDKLQLLTRARWLLFAAAGLGGLGLLLVCVSLGGQIVGARTWSAGAWSLLSGSLVLLIGMLSLAASILPVSDYPLRALLVDPSIAVAMDEPPGEEDNAMFPATGRTKAELGEEASGTQLPSDWQQALGPSGIETRLGDAIKAVLDREQGNPLAGIIVVTDGRNNAGLDPRSLILASQNLQVPLYFVGVGSDRSPANLKLVEVDAPKRIYPGDKFSLSTLLQASGFSGKTVDIQITAGPKSADPATYAIEAEQKVTINSDDELITTKFELAPKSVGEWVYIARVLATTDDAEAADNTQQTSVVVIERKNRVLIFAGGPTREYQFVRNLLFRDRDVDSHVLLQTGKTGISQEARQIIDTFPADRAALSRYDAVLAFDADWTKISDAQAQALEQWVAEQAGGLLMVAGTVEMPKWLARGTGGERSALLRSLSPVKLIQSGSRVLSTGRVESEKPWPLKLTTDGLQSDFMWLSDDPQTSAKLWNEFEGVYSYNAAYELKPGARALALFNDPTAADDSNLPIYVASQFYGAGRVVYQGGGELWRLRELGDAYFDRYYTKLVRWISQGRLLLDSDRGILLADRDQALLGDQVTIRAVLKDERFQPLLQSEVVARLLDPQKRNLPLVLRPLDGGNQPGVYTAQFPIQLAGEYTVQLQLGGLASSEVLSTSIKARVPALEMQHAERHDELLRPLATQTGGRYFQGIDAALMPEANGAQVAIAASIIPQDRVSTLPGVPNLRFQLRWLGWLMALIAGSLTIEWFARRLHRLA